MKGTERISLGNDSIRLVKDRSPFSSIRLVYEFTICPRCQQYQYWFRHDEQVTYLRFSGNLLFDVGSTTRQLGKEEFIDIPADESYRFRSLDRQIVKVFAFASTEDVERSWVQAGADLQRHMVIWRDGVPRYT